MKIFELISKIKIEKRSIIIVFILISCGSGIYEEAIGITRLVENKEINASLKMNQLYSFFLPKKQELQSLFSPNKKIGFYTDVLIPQDKEVVLYTFSYLLAPILLDKNYTSCDTILILCFLPESFERIEKQDSFFITFKEDYGFSKLAVLKKR